MAFVERPPAKLTVRAEAAKTSQINESNYVNLEMSTAWKEWSG